MDDNRKHLEASLSGNADNIDRLLGMLYLTGKKYNTEKIQKAYEYAKELHGGSSATAGSLISLTPLQLRRYLRVWDLTRILSVRLFFTTRLRIAPVKQALSLSAQSTARTLPCLLTELQR